MRSPNCLICERSEKSFSLAWSESSFSLRILRPMSSSKLRSNMRCSVKKRIFTMRSSEKERTDE